MNKFELPQQKVFPISTSVKFHQYSKGFFFKDVSCDLFQLKYAGIQMSIYTDATALAKDAVVFGHVM